MAVPDDVGPGGRILLCLFVIIQFLLSLQDPSIWLADEDEEDIESTCQATELHPVIRLCMIFLLLWQCMFHVSDAGIAVLVLFMHHLFRLLSSLTSSQYLSSLSKACPITLYSVRKLLGLLDDQFTEYVVCPTCHLFMSILNALDKTCREGGSPNVVGMFASQTTPFDNIAKNVVLFCWRAYKLVQAALFYAQERYFVIALCKNQ